MRVELGEGGGGCTPPGSQLMALQRRAGGREPRATGSLATALPCPHPRSRDYVLSCTDEAAKRRQALRGAKPTAWYAGRPRLTEHSWEKMWDSHLHWKRWTQERMGPSNTPL